MPSITIPDSALPAIQQLIALTPQQFDELLEGLASAVPTLKPDKFWSHVAPHVKQVDGSIVESVLKEVFQMHNTKDRMGGQVSEFADALVNGVRAVKAENFKLDEKSESILKERITKIFEGRKGFDVTTKSVDVLVDQSHVFYATKILTDIRPIFNDTGDSIDAAVIVHNLRISYGTGTGAKEFFVALDTSDIQALREVIDRAETKAKCLEGLLKKAGISYLDANE